MGLYVIQPLVDFVLDIFKLDNQDAFMVLYLFNERKYIDVCDDGEHQFEFSGDECLVKLPYPVDFELRFFDLIHHQPCFVGLDIDKLQFVVGQLERILERFVLIRHKRVFARGRFELEIVYQRNEGGGDGIQGGDGDIVPRVRFDKRGHDCDERGDENRDYIERIQFEIG